MLANKLANLIDEEQQTEILVVLSFDIFLHFCSKGFYRNIDIIIDDFCSDDISC